MTSYAQGKKAIGYCDRCGFQYPLHELKQEVVNLNVTNMLVCPECWDPDQPQTQLGRYHVNDPQALRNPRPPLGLDESRQFIDSQDGTPLKYPNSQNVTIDFSSTETTGGTGAYADSSLNGWYYRNRGSFPIEIGQSNAISQSSGILNCPWPDNSSLTTSFTNWQFYSGGSGLNINMSQNRYVRMKIRINNFGTSNTASSSYYPTALPWFGTLYWGVSDPFLINPYPFGADQNRTLPGLMKISDPNFVYGSTPTDWKILEWKVGDDSAGESNSASSWVNTAALGYKVRSLRFDLWAYPEDVDSEDKLDFDIEYIKVESE